MVRFENESERKSRNVIVTFPKAGKMLNKDGTIKGYFADVQLNQTDYDQKGAVMPQTNPHLVTNRVSDGKGGYLQNKNGQPFYNHRVFYDIKAVQEIMNVGKDTRVWTTKDPNSRGIKAYTEFDTNDMTDPNKQKDVAANFDNMKVSVNADIKDRKTKYGMHLMIDPETIKPSTVPFGKGSMAKQAKSLHEAKVISQNKEAQMQKDVEKQHAESISKDTPTANFADPVMGNLGQKPQPQASADNQFADRVGNTDTSATQDNTNGPDNPNALAGADSFESAGQVAGSAAKTDDPVANLQEVKGDTSVAPELSDDEAPF